MSYSPIFALCFFAGLYGCAEKPVEPPPQVVYRTPEDAWLVPCLILTPPAPLEFKQLTAEKQIQSLSLLVADQIQILKGCNGRTEQVRQWKADIPKPITQK